MNAEGRIVTAARWISGANGTLGGAAGTTGLGYGKSKWQRATEANRLWNTRSRAWSWHSTVE